MEAIVEYSTSGTVSDSLDPMETIAFGFIRNEIDRMHSRRNEVCEKRRAAAAARWERGLPKAIHKDAKTCSVEQSHAPYDIESVSVSSSESVSEPNSAKTSLTSTTGVRVIGSAGKAEPYDDSELLGRFFDTSNQATQSVLFQDFLASPAVHPPGYTGLPD